eukprot:CAMPEP_0198598066 /NCGR_PEP_ID=MMETSP1462-20131121/145210_1 /TAXON_ID=1333877 /ORGANISM="Brandtodinium nutriculum, Strain RCC3387" /LENGTH=196 /DNA_ID=CAMNT_0044329727 /DNA_START=1 /DNA_END=590 /DNA_ORIENTATION=-
MVHELEPVAGFGGPGGQHAPAMQNVTALGPKSPWTANLLSALGIMHFTNEEMKDTFDMMAVQGKLDKARVFELLKMAYGFEPMPEEMGLFVTSFSLEEDGELAWPELEAGFDEIRELLRGVAKNATEHTSTQDWKDDLTKHRRLAKDPMDKFKAPMTDSQTIGWHEEEVFNERFPKSTCPETRYADEMIKCRLEPF